MEIHLSKQYTSVNVCLKKVFILNREVLIITRLVLTTSFCLHFKKRSFSQPPKCTLVSLVYSFILFYFMFYSYFHLTMHSGLLQYYHYLAIPFHLQAFVFPVFNIVCQYKGVISMLVINKPVEIKTALTHQFL